MEVRHLRLLRELRDRGSVAAVAAATHRTPSAVSQQLRTAARELGVALVEPAGRGVRLTDAGRLLADGAVEVDAALERVQARLDAFRGQPSGLVRVVAFPSAAELLFPPLLTALAEAPITVRCTDLDVREADFAGLARDADLVVAHSLTGRAPAGTEGLVATVLLREPVDVALPASHPLAAHAVLAPEQVVDEPWISVPAGYPFATVLASVEAATGRRAAVTGRVRDNRLVEALVRAGQGIALLPRFTTRASDGLVLRPLGGVHAARWVVLLARPDRAERAVVRRVTDELVAIGAGWDAPA